MPAREGYSLPGRRYFIFLKLLVGTLWIEDEDEDERFVPIDFTFAVILLGETKLSYIKLSYEV